MSNNTLAQDARLARIASPFVKRTQLEDLIAENTFTLDQAAALIPMNSKQTLIAWLYRNKHLMPAPRYRDIVSPVGRVQHRVLTIDEIKAIRSIVMFGREDVRFRRFGTSDVKRS